MRKFSSLLLMPIVLLFAVNCSLFEDKVVPAAKKLAVEKVSKAIVDLGQCAQADLVKADVAALLKVESEEGAVVQALAGAPAGAQQEGIVTEICKSAANLVLPALLKKGVPAKWECSLADLNVKLKDLSVLACSQIPI